VKYAVDDCRGSAGAESNACPHVARVPDEKAILKERRRFEFDYCPGPETRNVIYERASPENRGGVLAVYSAGVGVCGVVVENAVADRHMAAHNKANGRSLDSRITVESASLHQTLGILEKDCATTILRNV
jgi:hypothetical protein